jgi:long-subunit fatty acid transport protein
MGLCLPLLSLAFSSFLWSQQPLIETGSSPTAMGAGVRSLSMGEAFVAIADDASSGSWNPAGLTAMERPEASMVLAWNSRRDDIHSTQHPEANTDSKTSYSDLNYLSYVHPLAWKGQAIALSLNYQKVFDFDKQVAFPFTLQSGAVTGGIQYSMEQEGGLTAWVPSIAWEPYSNFSLGLSVYVWGDDWTGSSSFEKREKSSGTLNLDLSNINPNLAGLVSIDDTLDYRQSYRVDSGISFNLGLMYRINSHWKVGAVVKPSYRLDMERHLDVAVRQVNAQSGLVYNDFSRSQRDEAQWTFPTTVAIGVARYFGDTTLISTDLTFTNWKEYGLKQGGIELNPISGLREKSKSTLAWRMGAEHLWIREKDVLAFRAGFGIDPEPAESSSDMFYTLSTGFGYILGDWVFDWGIRTRFGFNVGKSAYRGIDGEAVVTSFKSVSGVTYWF